MNLPAVRRLLPTDAQAYADIRLRGLREHPEAFTSSFEEDATRPLADAQVRLTASPQRPHDAFWGAFSAQQLVGVVGIQGRYRAKERHTATVVGLYVANENRGLGNAQALVAALLAFAKSCEELVQLDLTVTVGNDSAMRLYEQLGFASWGVYRGAIRVGGRPWDKAHMVLRLR